MQLRYVFTELGQGLRRNLSMHVAVVLTLFVSLTLVGAGVLLRDQAGLVEEKFGNEFEIAVTLCRDNDRSNPACAAEADQAQIDAIQEVVDASPEVESSRFETKEEGFEKLKKFYDADYLEGPNAAITADDMPQQIWVTLKDPQRYEGIVSSVQGLDGVAAINDQREAAEPMFETINTLRDGSLLVALILVVAALLLVANTIRLAAFARRKEIGIMRLVGASTIYITLPFLLEALVIAAISVVLAGGALAALIQFGIQGRLADSLEFIPWITWSDSVTAAIVVGVTGPLLTLLPTLLLTRKYIKV
ncbi:MULTISPECIES: permease-like cell division protein FtsX [Nocardioides]|uniref:Cell division protein FtsX n=1 Tax=Nocardioides lianchengensis TaxID=1045774 RepID=A0A1G6JX75_9ACTN|nr:permease-like cell division protein FtsX [Nocardioides lianchengensis]NYG08790.1 cell division transport system permease protein [Nocardioides lianchengensis]SDC22596.1 cell division transport system permease protein [Nocardioides lianchengensis]